MDEIYQLKGKEYLDAICARVIEADNKRKLRSSKESAFPQKKYRRHSDTIHLVDKEEVVQLLDFIRASKLVAWSTWDKRTKRQSTATHAFIHIGDVNVTVTVRGYKSNKTKTYQFRLDDEEIVEEVRAPGLMAQLSKIHKVEDVAKTGSKFLLNALKYGVKGKHGGKKFGIKAYPRTKQNYHPELAMTRLYDVWYADANSFYSSIFIGMIPDSSKREFCAGQRVKPGWIGFRVVRDHMILAHEGENAWFQMPLMESPWKSLIQEWFNKKQEARAAKDFVTEAKYKAKLNSLVGTLKYKDPFLWSYIVLRGREIMDSLVDENTIMVHTDSIVSLKPIKNIKEGTGLGEFKVKHLDSFVFQSTTENFQINFEPPTIKGMPKSLFKPGWDMTKDPMPRKGLYPWRVDKEKLQLVRNEKYENFN